MIAEPVTTVVMRTPKGNQARFSVRSGTTDWMTAEAACGQNEYNLPSDLTGWALDVGAHIGGVTIPLLIDNPGLSVVAIEALTENVQVLKANVALNGLPERFLHLEGPASCDHEPVTVFYGRTDEDFARQHRFIGNADWQGDDRQRVTAPGVTLADVIARVGPLRFLKIDCEGCEWAFLDSPAVAEVEEIVGEFHPRQGYGAARLRELLGPTHEVTVDDTADWGPFRAVRRG